MSTGRCPRRRPPSVVRSCRPYVRRLRSILRRWRTIFRWTKQIAADNADYGQLSDHLMEHANGLAKAEHGLTVVRRDRRGRGIARALKRAQLHWAARSGVVELVTWTQKGNEAMQALNASLGYENRSRVLTMQGPLP